MATTLEQRTEAYNDLPEDIKILYSSEGAASVNRTIIERFTIPQEKIDTYLDITGDAILGFYKIADIPRLLQQKLSMSADDSQRLVSQIIEFLSPIVEREAAQLSVKKEELVKLTNTFAQPSPDRLENPHSAELATNVAPLRTMEADMNRIHGYGAYTALRSQQEEAEDATHTSTQADVLHPTKDTPQL